MLGATFFRKESDGRAISVIIRRQKFPVRLSLIPSDVFISRRQELKTRTGCTDGRAGSPMGNKQGYQMP